MAIAYFIPDQSKLLERSSGGPYNNNNNNNSAMQGNSAPTMTTTTTTPTAAATNANCNNHNIHNNNNNYRANITIPLNPFAPTHTHHVGCWDLITQVFCYALRFYNEAYNNEAGRGSPLIKITVEISGGTSGGNGSPPSNTTTQQQPTSQSAPKRKN